VSETTSIKPCPFCGWGAIPVQIGRRAFKWVVKCCDCGAETMRWETQAAAIEDWNRRVPFDMTRCPDVYLLVMHSPFGDTDTGLLLGVYESSVAAQGWAHWWARSELQWESAATHSGKSCLEASRPDGYRFAIIQEQLGGEASPRDIAVTEDAQTSPIRRGL